MAGVLGRLFEGMQEARTALAVMQTIQRYYRLTLNVPPHDVTAALQRIGTRSTNVHELAVWYLSYFVEQIEPDHPKAVSEVTKYIRVAKMALEKGFIEDAACVDALCYRVLGRPFGVDPSSIAAGDAVLESSDRARQTPSLPSKAAAHYAIVLCPRCRRKLRVPAGDISDMTCDQCGGKVVPLV